MKKSKYILFPMVLAVALTGLAKSQTTDWGSSVSFNPITHSSDGNIAGTSYVWTIGWFNDGFIPDATNYASWASNYNVVDTNSEQIFNLGPPTNSDVYVVSGHKDDGGASSYGKQAYIFVYNDLGLIGLEGGEALLLRENSFLFPDAPNQDSFDIADNPLDTKDDSFDVIWGQVDRNLEGVGGVVTGAGILTNPLADVTAGVNGNWEVQTAAWAVVPEPSVALLGALGSLVLLRRQRNRTL